MSCPTTKRTARTRTHRVTILGGLLTNKHTDSYDDRNKKNKYDMADECMQKYLKSEGLIENKDWMKIGTDPKTNDMKLMWLAIQILLIPDYIFVMKDKLYLAEVKGTLRFKESDYLHLKEMYERSEPYDNVRVGITYFAHPDAKPFWLSFARINAQWNDERIPIQYYPELDFEGNKKAYKMLLKR
tara:strand:- start:850 stop:1404 length:555 start_codon:yes stop_codon:yes gene_type:complete